MAPRLLVGSYLITLLFDFIKLYWNILDYIGKGTRNLLGKLRSSNGSVRQVSSFLLDVSFVSKPCLALTSVRGNWTRIYSNIYLFPVVRLQPVYLLCTQWAYWIMLEGRITVQNGTYIIFNSILRAPDGSSWSSTSSSRPQSHNICSGSLQHQFRATQQINKQTKTQPTDRHIKLKRQQFH